MGASIILCCAKWPPTSNFVTFCTPGASAFTWVAFLFTGKFPANLSVVEKHNILLLRRKTCALLRAKTSALVRRKTCAVLRNRTRALFRANTKENHHRGAHRGFFFLKNNTFIFLLNIYKRKINTVAPAGAFCSSKTTFSYFQLLPELLKTLPKLLREPPWPNQVRKGICQKWVQKLVFCTRGVVKSQKNITRER